MNILNFSPIILDIIIEYIGPLHINNLFWTNHFFQHYIIRYLRKFNNNNESVFSKFNLELYTLTYDIINNNKIKNHAILYYGFSYNLILFPQNDLVIKNFFQPIKNYVKIRILDYIYNTVNYHKYNLKKYNLGNEKIYKTYYKLLLLYPNRIKETY